MPNWVTNRIKLDGPPDQARKFWDAVLDENSNVDFEKIIPMPKELMLVQGSCMYNAIYAALREDGVPSSEAAMKSGALCGASALEKWRSDMMSDADANVAHEIVYDSSTHPDTYADYVLYGRAYLKNKELCGHMTWYDWCLENWGTKWNACDTRSCDGWTYFDTAWSDPEGIINRLPFVLENLGCDDLELTWEWAEEQGFYAGRYKYKYVSDDRCVSGFCVIREYWESDEDAYAMCESILGYSSATMEEDDDYECC